jgi:hypothetical protein
MPAVRVEIQHNSLGVIDIYCDVGIVGLGADHHPDAGLRTDYEAATGCLGEFEAHPLHLTQILNLNTVQHDVHVIEFLLHTIEVGLTQVHRVIQVGLMFGHDAVQVGLTLAHDPLDFGLLAGQELAVYREVLMTGQHTG